MIEELWKTTAFPPQSPKRTHPRWNVGRHHLSNGSCRDVVVCGSRAEQRDDVNPGCVGCFEGDGLQRGGYSCRTFHICQLHLFKCPPNETMNGTMSLKRQAPRVWLSASTLGENGWSCTQAVALQWLVFVGAVIRYVWQHDGARWLRET